MALTITALAAGILSMIKSAADSYSDFARQYVALLTAGC